MAGNAREWTASAVGDERHILGGSWSDPAHEYFVGERVSPWSRAAGNGFRCARYTHDVAKTPAPPERSWRDYSVERPVSDETFRSYRGFYAYDRSDLSAVVEAVEEDEHWRREKVTFDAPYGHERVTAHLFLPRNVKPPYQTLVFYPTGEASIYKSSDRLRMSAFDFLIRSGRAVLHPVYKGTYERAMPTPFEGPNARRDLVVQQVKDFRRSLDYLETRTDIDTSRLGILGVSNHFPVYVLALDERLKVGLLHATGLSPGPLPAEIDPLHFAPRVRQPVLILNGRYDSDLLVEQMQKPMHRLLGTPEKDKRLVLVESGHAVVRSLDRVRESLDWLDRYLGPVQEK